MTRRMSREREMDAMMRRNESAFASRGFAGRLSTMFRVDARRMLGAPLFWVCLGLSFAVPILVLVMTSMAGGQESGLMFTNTWQIIGSESGDLGAMMAGMTEGLGTDASTAAAGAGMNEMAGMAGIEETAEGLGTDASMGAAAGAGMMGMTAMMNINLIYFMIAVFVCLFTAEDFRSGYAKNLFTVRARKTDYVASKTLIGFIAGSLFLLAFFLGGVLGGSVAGLPMALGEAGVSGLVMCMLAKIFLTAVFASIFLLMSVFAKSRSWLSICLSLFGGMLLFMMIPMMSPLDSGVGNVGMCLAGGGIFAVAIGAVSNMVLKRTNLVG